MLTLDDLNKCFEQAKETYSEYIAIMVVNGSSEPEIIINPKDNFEEKQAYYNRVYDANLIQKFSKDVEIKITGFVYGDDFEELQNGIDAIQFLNQ